MKNVKIAISMALFFAGACATQQKQTVSWHESMKGLSETLSLLMPVLASEDLEKNEADRDKALRLTRDLAERAHDVSDKRVPPNADPNIKLVSRDFRAETKTAVTLMETGHWAQAQKNLLQVTGYCFGCHSMGQGPSSRFSLQLKPNLSAMTELQQADFYAAIRQFDSAIIHYENVLADAKWASTHENEWNEGFEKLLAITVRVRNNPSLTMELISRFFDSNTYPQGLNQTARVWRKHAKEWREESQDVDPIQRARDLLSRAEALNKTPEDRRSLVLYLRASSILHNQMSRPKAARDQEVLFLAGEAARGLGPFNYWAFPDDYFETCARIDKKSEWGRACSRKLEANEIEKEAAR